MDIQIERTPPKKQTQFLYPSTPPKKTRNTDSFNTPIKKTPQLSTPVKRSGENPQSKKFKMLGSHKKTPGSSNRKITQFSISRLDQDYIYEKKLGQGNFSSVGLYRSRMTGDLFAIKETKASRMSVNQVQALGTLSIFSQKSKNIIRYFHSWVESNELYLVMQFCNESFAQIIENKRRLKTQFFESAIKQILKQSLQGLKCMHENKMVHLDLKPDNMLFKDTVLKISDLGLTRSNNLKRNSELEEGDSRYLAKQILNYYNGIDLTKSDIFSLGMAIYEAISLEQLPNNGEYWLSIRHNGLNIKDRMDLQEYSHELLSIVEAMTRPNWQNRPSASQVLQSPYFKEASARKNRLFMNHKFPKERKNQSSL